MTDDGSKVQTFFQELKRRRVFRVAAVYGVVAFVIIQIVEITFPALHIPDWAQSLVVIVLLLGFPVAVGLGWAFDITDQGIVRTRGTTAQMGASRKPLTSNRALIVIAGLAIAFGVWSRWGGGVGTTGQIRSIAVLPLDNLMNEPEQDYFVEGMHEAIITNLSRIGALKVISRTSAMRYKGTDKLVPQIAQELGVDAVVEGSVLKGGGRVRISAQLIHGQTDEHLWSAEYERELEDILSLQSEVAQAIAGEIEVALTPAEEARLASARPVNPEAHEAYLKGRYFWNQRGKGIEKAIDYFKQALEIDPNYALAYAGLAACYVVPAVAKLMPPKDALPRGKAAALKALEIDSTLAEAHTSLAYALLTYDWDWPDAEREFQRAIELNPNYATAHQWYAEYLAAMARLNDAIVEVKRAEELDPLSLIISWNVGRILLFARRYEETIEQMRKTLELEPESGRAWYLLGKVYEQQGMYDEWITEYEKALRDRGVVNEELAAFRQTYAEAGMRGVWQKRLQHLEKQSHQAYVFPYEFASLYALLGKNDQAFEWLEKAYQARDFSYAVVDLRVDPDLDPLRSDPRFQDLLRRMNFPE